MAMVERKCMRLLFRYSYLRQKARYTTTMQLGDRIIGIYTLNMVLKKSMNEEIILSVHEEW